MSPEFSGILIGIGSTAGAGVIIWIASMLVRLWHTPKRLDRLETVVPPMAHGIWALLRIHISEHNGNTDPDIKKAYDDLTEVVTKGVVSQKVSQ